MKVTKLIIRISLLKKLLNNIVKIPEQHVSFWEKTLNIEIEEWEWYNSFSECKKWTVSTKLRSFYYQVRVGDIMTNSKLVKMRIKLDSRCEWCNYDTQDMIHLFWDCKVVNTIWDKLSAWISEKIGCYLKIEKELVFLHDIEAGNFTTIINLLILIASRYIYVCHCTEKVPCFKGCKKLIDEIEHLEMCIAKKNNTVYKHKRKWRQLYQ